MEALGISFAFDWEIRLMAFLQAHLGEVGEFLAVSVTLLGEQLMVVVVLGFLYWCYDKNLARRVGASALTAMLWGLMLKSLILRRRPYMDHPEIRVLRPVEPGDVSDPLVQGYSFPSAHTTLASSTYWPLAAAAKNRLVRGVFLVLPLLIGVSRFLVGVHYPTDVLAGFALGALGLLVSALLNRYAKKEWVYNALLVILVLPGLLFCRTSDYYTLLGVLLGYLAGDAFEKRFVNFENTRGIGSNLLRLTGGAAIYFALNALLKLPFDPAFLASGSMAALLVRAARYTIILFVDIGLYPMAFMRLEKRK